MWAWFLRLFSNPKTTILGLTTLASGGAVIAGMVKGNVAVTPESISTVGGTIAAGVGLIAAGDGGTTTTDSTVEKSVEE